MADDQTKPPVQGAGSTPNPQKEITADDLMKLWGMHAEPTAPPSGAESAISSSSAPAPPPVQPAPLPPKPEPPRPTPTASRSDAESAISRPSSAVQSSPTPPRPTLEPQAKVPQNPQPKPVISPEPLVRPKPTPAEAGASAISRPSPLVQSSLPPPVRPPSPKPPAAPRPAPRPEPLLTPKPPRPEPLLTPKPTPAMAGASAISPPPESRPSSLLKKEPEKPKPQALEGEIVVSTNKERLSGVEKSNVDAEKKVEKDPELVIEKESFGERLMDVIHQLPISGAGILRFFGCIILLAGVAYGAWYGWNYYSTHKNVVTLPTEKPETVSGDQTGVPSATQLGQAQAIDPTTIGSTGLAVVASLGAADQPTTPLAEYILLFRRIENAYESDINQLLDSSTDRRGRLNSHLALLRRLMSDGQEALIKIQAEIAAIQVVFDAKSVQQTTDEKSFFEQIDSLNPTTTDEALTSFIVVSKDIVALKARSKALQKMEALFVKALPKVDTRVQDIKLNAEALISGIKIYDVSGSNLNLVVPLGTEDRTNTVAPSTSSSTGGNLPRVVPVGLDDPNWVNFSNRRKAAPDTPQPEK